MAKGGEDPGAAPGMPASSEQPAWPKKTSPTPFAIQLLLILAGFGLLPLFAADGNAQTARYVRSALGAAFAIWVGAVGLGLGLLILELAPALADEDPAAALSALFGSMGPGRQILSLYLGLTTALFAVSLGMLYVHARQAQGASLFSALYVLVASFSATMSAMTTFLGVQLVFQTEDASLFSNWVLPVLLSAFVFVFALALWVGGGDAVHTRHWTLAGRGPLAIALGFFERLTKWALLAIPGLALFVLSTWTSALGLGGKEAVKLHYQLEVARLVDECERTVQYSANEEAFLVNLRQTVDGLTALAAAERSGALSGVSGSGPASLYLMRLTEWLDSVATAAQRQLRTRPGETRQPAMRELCEKENSSFATRFKNIGAWNYNRWERLFANQFNRFRATITEWRERPTIVAFVATQLAARDLAVAPPTLGEGVGSARVREVLEGYTQQVDRRLADLVAEFDVAPPRALPPTPAWDVADWLPIERPERSSATAGEIAGLQFISARQAILQYAFLAIDIWAFAIAWDFASYALIIIYIFFPGLGRWNTGGESASA